MTFVGAGFVVAAASLALTQAVPSSFVVAIDEFDHLLPIARYAEGKWLNTWPKPEEESVPVPRLADVPIRWMGRPVPREWTLWYTSGGSRTITVSGIDRSGGCVVPPKLVIEDPPPRPHKPIDDVHRGLATTDRVPVGTVHRVLSSDRRWNALRPPIERVFAAHERRAVDDYPGHWTDMRERLSPSRMARQKISIDWLYLTEWNGSEVYYFEASKRDAGNTERSFLRIGINGWIRRARNGTTNEFAIEGQPYWDDNDAVSDRIPIGVLHVDGALILVMEFHTGETGGFELLEVGSSDVRSLVVADAGGC